MEWSDEAIVLNVRPLGENSVVLEVLTREHGRHGGLVRGGTSRRIRGTLQPGNTLRAHWRARLSEHLGSFTVEAGRLRAGDMMESREALAGLNAFTSVASAVLPDREPHVPVFDASLILLEAIAADSFLHWGPLFVRWEMGLLETLGFGLDLSRCAATGTTDDLRYVSPRTGRAVSGEAGAPYHARLLALPGFLLGSQNAEPVLDDVVAGLRLTAFYLLDRVLRPHNRELPAPRTHLAELAVRESA